MLSKEQVLDRLKRSIRLKGQQHDTEQSYCRVAARYYDFRVTCPRGWTHERIAEEYLSRRVTEDDVSASTQNHDRCRMNVPRDTLFHLKHFNPRKNDRHPRSN